MSDNFNDFDEDELEYVTDFSESWSTGQVQQQIIKQQQNQQMQSQLGAGGPINFSFSGDVQQLDMTLVNPYTGENIEVSGQYNVNNTSYTGAEFNDSVSMTNLGDALFIRDALGQQVVNSVEIFFAGQGGDIIHLADTEYVLNDLTVFGSSGNDILWANVGDDVVLGEAGDDHLVGGPGNDDLRGGDDNDYLSGGSGDDKLDGGNGDDVLVGGVGSDVYITGLGSDVIIEVDNTELNYIHLQNGLTELDLSYTAAGRDLIVTYAGLGEVRIEDHFVGDNGIDAIILDNGTGASVSLRNLGIGATDGDDVFNGTTGDDALYGGLGSDLLSGGEGNDTLYYSSDEVWPTGFVAWNVGSPDAIVNGERIVVNPRYRNHDGFDGGEGNDVLIMGDDAEALFLDDRYSPNPFGTNTARLVSVENIYAGGGDDIVDLTSKQFSYGDVNIYGEDGDDVLWSNAGDDLLNGGAGNDHLDGGSGLDTLIGGSGDDTMYGRSGTDLFIVGEGLDTIYTGTGADIVEYDFVDDQSDVLKDFTTGVGGDVLDLANILDGYNEFFSEADDFVQLIHQGGDDVLYVNADGDLGGAFTALAIFEGGAGSNVTQMMADGNLVLDNSPF